VIAITSERRSASLGIRILDHLPVAIVELRAFVEMMEGDAK